VRNGWDEIRGYQYETPESAQRETYARALRDGARWTIVISDIADAVAEKRDSQLEVLFGKLWPAGYAPPSYAGKKAHPLDQARIAELADFVESARRELDIPGVALGLIDKGEIVFAEGFGVRTLGEEEAVTADTAFLIGSNGKALTTLLLAKLVEAGKLTWDTPVASVWPAFALGDAEVTGKVLVRHLVCACTGLPRRDFELLFESENATPAAVVRLLAGMQPTSAFGELYQYSNLMGAAGGYLAAHVHDPERELGAAYDAAMQSLVFDPLDMAATTFDYARAQAGEHASPHGEDINGVTRVASMDLNAANHPSRPDGAQWSTLNDMLAYVRMELSEGKMPDGSRFIGAGPLLERRKPQVAEGSDEFYGMGLKTDAIWGTPMIRHGGSMAGFQSDMIWLPEHGVGAVILTNADSGAALRSQFRRRLLEVLFDGEPAAERDLIEAARGRKAVAAETRAGLALPADPRAVKALARRYRSPTLGDLAVKRRKGAVVFDFGGWDSEMATRTDGDGAVTFVTISPGESGFEFLVADTPGERRLIIREAQAQHVFTEVR
jgi:CubicO group peptidase (beta-lactamase class C family)